MKQLCSRCNQDTHQVRVQEPLRFGNITAGMVFKMPAMPEPRLLCFVCDATELAELGIEETEVYPPDMQQADAIKGDV